MGREAEIAELVQSLSKANNAVAAISGVRGMGGIGKTELAYAVAQQLVGYFPDAQLFLDLRGSSTNPLTSEQVLQTVIRAFEPEAKLPDELDALQSLYHSLLTGKRVLVLADDAKNADQVRFLLPPPGSALLVTSRNRFAVPGMFTRDLGPLLPAEAEQLLLRICPRIGKHALRLAKLCGYLPLALRVTASLLANSTRTVESYLELLQNQRARLRAMKVPDDTTLDLEASLSLSYQALEQSARSAFAQLSSL